MRKGLKYSLALFLLALISTMSISWASDDHLIDVVRQLIKVEPKPCADNTTCYCVEYNTQYNVELRYTQAQYCRAASLLNGSLVVKFTSRDNNKKKVDEGEFVSGKMHGTWISWHPNGVKAAESPFEYGKQAGTFTTWHENGQVAVTGQHVDDKPHGIWLYRDMNGEIQKRFEWNHGKLVSRKESN